MDILEAKNKIKKNFLKKANVVSVGLATKRGQPCISVGVSKKMPLTMLTSKDVIPSQCHGFNTDVIEIGTVRALENTGIYRPAPGGVSIGHVAITAGTLGCLVKDSEEVYILSNNHVMANSNAAKIGDDILQPGPVDGGSEVIANLSDFEPINFGGSGGACPWCDAVCDILILLQQVICGSSQISRRVAFARLLTFAWNLVTFRPRDTTNFVDAAIAKPVSLDLVQADILEIGVPAGHATIGVGDSIQKSGRTTEYTTGSVLQSDATVQVQYGAGQIAVFEDQLLGDIRSAGGDSGSAVLDMEANVVGLLFAGSDTVTVFNKIQYVLDVFGVDIVTE